MIAKKTTEEVKPGYRTTEFWLSTLAMIVGSVMASGVLDSLDESNWIVRVIGGIVVVLSALGYDATRSKVKAKEKEDAGGNS
jgi:hypothetical protein